MTTDEILRTMAYALSEAVDAKVREAKWLEADRIRDVLGLKPMVISVLGDEKYYPNLVVWSDVALEGKYDKADLLEMIRKGARIYLDQFGLISSLQ